MYCFFFQRAVDDLDFYKTFHGGRYSFDYMVKEISHTMDHFGRLVKEKTLWPLPSLCIPLEVTNRILSHYHLIYCLVNSLKMFFV